MTYDVAHRKLRRGKSGGFRLGDVYDWTVENWPEIFRGKLPRDPRSAEVVERAHARDVTSDLVLPGTLGAAHAVIGNLHEQLSVCKAGRAAAEIELSEARPKATSWDDWNRNKKKRRGGVGS